MLVHAEEAMNFCAGLDAASFAQNRQVRWAVIKLIQIVGEASIRVGAVARAAHTSISWKELRAMRNILVHEYHGIDDAIVWKTATEDLPGLVDGLRSALEKS